MLIESEHSAVLALFIAVSIPLAAACGLLLWQVVFNCKPSPPPPVPAAALRILRDDHLDRHQDGLPLALRGAERHL